MGQYKNNRIDDSTGVQNIGLSPTGVTFPAGIAANGLQVGVNVLANDTGYTITTTDNYGTIAANITTSSDQTITLPAAASSVGRTLRISRGTGTGTGKLIVDGNASETISGQLVRWLRLANECLTLVCFSSSGWTVLAHDGLVTQWAPYTPTTSQGFGTPTYRLQWRRVLENVEIAGDFTTGTNTAVEARIGLPNAYTANYVAATGRLFIGHIVRDTSATLSVIYVGVVHGQTYITFARIGDGGSGNPVGTPDVATATFANSERQSFNIVGIPVSELKIQ